ncbi:hypothetical protein A2U01_0097365, partial [Trifolium medium]|nr:hypothetical protein [Trifolium medium]
MFPRCKTPRITRTEHVPLVQSVGQIAADVTGAAGPPIYLTA